MERAPLVIVAPRLPPQACGLGTYAWQLNQHWPGDQMANRFLVIADAAVSREHLQTKTIENFPPNRRGFAHVLEQQQTCDVLLHYAGRAYHRFGFPRWMPAAFASWRKRDARRRLHVVFHELPADLPLLSKQGILQRLSFGVARPLAEQATSLITNSEHHAAVLHRWSLQAPVEWFPVPSNIPAPDKSVFAGLQRRRGEFVIFGMPYTRFETLRTFREWLSRWKRSGRLSRLHLIGPRDDKFTPQADAILAGAVSRVDVVEHGEVEAAKVSSLLLEVELSLSISTERTWSKSGTLMAYAAHSCPIVIECSSKIGLLRFAIAASDLESTEGAGAEKGARLRQWYLENADWDLTAKRVAEIVARN